MPRLVFSFALAAFAAWSLLGLLAWGVVSLGGDLLRAASPFLFFGHPDGPAIADAASRVLTAMGGGLVAFVWLAGSVVLLAGTLMLRALGTADVRVARFEFRGGRTDGPGWSSRPMKDVTPSRQSEHDRSDHEQGRLPGPSSPERRD
jgi:hypothetical protein